MKEQVLGFKQRQDLLIYGWPPLEVLHSRILQLLEVNRFSQPAYNFRNLLLVRIRNLLVDLSKERHEVLLENAFIVLFCISEDLTEALNEAVPLFARSVRAELVDEKVCLLRNPNSGVLSSCPCILSFVVLARLLIAQEHDLPLGKIE